MPLYIFYTMVQKSQKWPKTQIKRVPALKSGSHKKELFWNFVGLEPTVLNHRADESWTCQPDTPPDHLHEDGPVVYPANAFDSHLRGDSAPLVQVWQNLKKRLFGFAARNRLSLSLPLSCSSSSYFLSFSKQKKKNKKELNTQIVERGCKLVHKSYRDYWWELAESSLWLTAKHVSSLWYASLAYRDCTLASSVWSCQSVLFKRVEAVGNKKSTYGLSKL